MNFLSLQDAGKDQLSCLYLKVELACCRSIAEKGPSTEEKIQSLEAVISNYEVKVSGLEHEIETQREEYEQKLEQFTKRSVDESTSNK